MDVNIVNVQGTVKSQQTVTQVHQIRTTRHYEHYYAQRYKQHSRSTLNHSYDPNMCTTAARFTDAFYSAINNTTDSASVTELQAAPPSTSAPEEDLLCYNNVVLLHETAEIGAEAIVGNTELLDESSPLTSLQTQIHVQEETFVSNYQFMQCTQPAMDTNSNTQFAGMVIQQRSPNGHLHDVNMYDAHQAAVVEEETQATHLNNFEIPTQFTFPHEPQGSAVDENSVELMAKFAADLANLSTVAEHFEPMNRQLALASKDHQRMLLESTMSPLLAAVNDITKRDAELKTYFNQNLEKEPTLSTTEYLQDENNYYNKKDSQLGQTKKQNTENGEDSSDEDDYLLVSDKPVECRSKASLPTKYLYFGNAGSNTHVAAPSVYAKKSIPHRTKFGPFEGEIQFVSEIDLDVLHVQTPRYYPLLMVDDCHMLDVTNEDSSNWMRFIRLAQNYAEQNLQILLEDGKIFLKCIRRICPKEELRVGYHSSYAARFFLPSLEPTIEDLRADYSRVHPWKCFECEKCCTTLDELRKHLNTHDDSEGELVSLQKSVKKRRRKVRLKNKQMKQNNLKCNIKHLNNNGICCNLCRRVFMTNESLKKHVAKHHSTHTVKQKCVKVMKNSNNKIVKQKESKYMYKCNLCAKRFHNEARLHQHKLKHDDNISKPHVCSKCQQQCSTPAALAAHERSHTGTQYACVFCAEKFKYVRDFKKHVEVHRSANHTYQCMHCNKHYSGYHLLRKHVHLFHVTKTYNCDKCNKKFQNNHVLQRHMLLHSQVKSYACEVCNRRFNRKDHLNTHLKRLHRLSKPVKKSKEKQKKHKAKNENYEAKEQATKCVTSTPEISGTCKSNDQIETTMTTYSKTEYIVPVPLSLLPPKLPRDEMQQLNSKKPTSSNRRKQTPTKLKALELNAETVTYVALSEMLSPFIITEKDLYAEFKKPTVATNEKSQSNPPKIIANPMEMETQPQSNSDLSAEVTLSEEKPSFQNTVNRDTNTSAQLKSTDGAISLYPFKCHICPHSLFKRRGMLVNHFAKMHPTVNVNEIELLSTPIMRQQLMYPCPYCNKIYKLNAKRKGHILKHHPGQELPTSMRRQQQNTINCDAPIETQIQIGTLAVSVHKCNLCYKQYAARNRLVSHYRKSHPNEPIPLQLPEYLPTMAKPPPLIHDDTMAEVENYQPELLEPEINIIPYHLQPPVSPENKLLKLSSAALELSRFDFLNERCSNDHLVSNVFTDHTTHGELNRLPELFAEAAIADIDATSMEKYNRSIEAQFFEKISKFS